MNTLPRQIRLVTATPIALAVIFGYVVAWPSPDLWVQSVSADCATNSLTLAVVIQNDGDTGAGAFDVAVLLSIDAVIDPVDIELARTRIGTLAPGATESVTGVLTFPSVAPGTYAVGARVDPDNDIAESNENNNAFAGTSLSLPCLSGDPEIHIQKLLMKVSQEEVGEVEKGLFDRREASTNLPMHIVRVSDRTSRDAAVALIARAGGAVVHYPYLPPHHFLFRGSEDVVERVLRDPRVTKVFPASLAIVAGLPTIPCTVEESPQARKYATRGVGWDGPGPTSAALTYYVDDTDAAVDPIEFRDALTHALDVWSLHADVVFTETDGRGEDRSIDIRWARLDHGDGSHFDGFGGIVAHSFFPTPTDDEPLAGDLHLDADESWSIAPGSGVHVYSVLLHELGHCLGLNHSDDPDAVMYPQIYFAEAFEDLATDDIEGIHYLYATPPGPHAFNINNTGDNLLRIESITPEPSALWLTTLPAVPFDLLPHATQRVEVVVDFTAAPPGASSTRLLVMSNDSDESPYPGGVYVDVTALDLRPPSVVIGPPSASITREGPVTFTLAFPGAEAVALDAEDVILHTTGTAAAIAGVEGSGTADRVVVLSDCFGDGEVRISLAEGVALNEHGISPESGVSDAILVDNTPPTVRLEQPSYDSVHSTVHITAVYSEAASIILGDNQLLLETTGSAAATARIEGDGLAVREVVIVDIRGNGTLALSIGPGTAQDAVGNVALASNRIGPIPIESIPALPPYLPSDGATGCNGSSSGGPRGWDLLITAAVLVALSALEGYRKTPPPPSLRRSLGRLRQSFQQQRRVFRSDIDG